MVSIVDNPLKSRGGSRGGEKGDYSPPSLSITQQSYALDFSIFRFSRVIFFVCLFLLRMNKPQTYQRNIDKYIH